MNKIMLVLGILLLAGCGTQDFVDTAGSAKNSVACINGMYSGTWANGNLRGTRLRFPEGYDVTELDPDQVKTLAEVLCR